MIRRIPLVGEAIEAVSPDPLSGVARAVGMDRPVIARRPQTGESITTTFAEAQKLREQGWEIQDTGQRGTEPKPLSMFSREGQGAMGLAPEGAAQKLGAVAVDIAEFFGPGKLVTAGGKALAATKAAQQLGATGKFAAQALPEVASAVGVSKIQGQEDVGATGLLAAASPLYGRALNWTGKKLPAAIAEKIPEVSLSPRQMLWKALKPINRNLQFDDALTHAVPELYETAKQTGRTINNLDDLIALTKETKARIWKPYEDFLGRTKAMIDGNRIADAMVKAIPKRIRLKDPGAFARIREFADAAYRGKRLRLQDAEEFLQNANADTQSFYAMFPAARHAATEASPGVASSIAEAGALRSAINEKVDMISGIIPSTRAKTGTPIDVRKIKQVYGGLSNIQGEAYRRVNVAKRLAPESLTEQLGAMKAAGKFALGIATGSPVRAAGAFAEAYATRAAGKWIKERNTSDYLIKRAFASFGKEVEKWRKGQRLFIATPSALNIAQNP